MGVFARMLMELADKERDESVARIDATHLKTHRTASSLRGQRGGRRRLIGRTKGGLNSKPHALPTREAARSACS